MEFDHGEASSDFFGSTVVRSSKERYSALLTSVLMKFLCLLRCELVVVCGEDTERLASGLVKPFLVHLKAAEDQYATGTKEIKLKPTPGYGQGLKPEALAWFTKGTIERF